MKYVLLALLPGCFLPVATGAPESATTVGKGNLGLSLSAEAPTIDLIAQKNENGVNDYTDTYGESPAAAMRATLSYGITDTTDIEVAAEGQLWFFFLPLPTGGSIGFRQHLDAGDTFDAAIAARVGGVSSGSVSADSMGNSTSDDASAYYGALSGVMETRHGWLRPLLSLQLMPFSIKRGISGEPIQHFKGLTSSATFALMLVGRHVQFGPYVTGTNFESQEFAGAWLGSFGLMLAIRPDRDSVKL
jgi:hypothetical protein